MSCICNNPIVFLLFFWLWIQSEVIFLLFIIDNAFAAKVSISILIGCFFITFFNFNISKSLNFWAILFTSPSLIIPTVLPLIFLTNKPPIIINSKFATHNKANFNTKFFQNVRVNHDNLKIESDNLDLIYDKNLVNLYNIFKINFDDNILKADKIIFDMLTKDVSINMYDDEEKINLFYKVNNGNN